jgi:two-component system chemotaxis sensor kinase CheA
VAEKKGVTFSITIADDLPTVLSTDPQRLQQILNNLLSNAFKFTGNGEVQLNIWRAASQSPLPSIFKREHLPISHKTVTNHPLLKNGKGNPIVLNPEKTIAFSVSDSGIGIPKDKQELIFRAFQ